MLRPAKKHRFRFQYLPISYEADAPVRRSFVFNGQRYNIGLPVQTEANFKTYRFGYEFDFLQFKRGWLGVLLDLKYTEHRRRAQQPDRRGVHDRGGADPDAWVRRPRLPAPQPRGDW